MKFFEDTNWIMVNMNSQCIIYSAFDKKIDSEIKIHYLGDYKNMHFGPIFYNSIRDEARLTAIVLLLIQLATGKIL